MDADGRSVWTIPILTLGLASGPAGWLILGATIAATAWVGYELYHDTAVRSVVTNTWEATNGLVGIYLASKKKNLNPFDGPVDEDVITVDPAGNAIPVPEGNWLGGSKDGEWIQEMAPDGKEGSPTGLRKDGGGHPKGPKHPDPRGWEPHGHRPGVSNPDGTPWLPIH